MRIQADLHYAQPPAAVSTMIFDERFQDAKCVATGALEHSVDIVTDGDRTRITTERALPTDGFPDFIRSFVGSSLTVIQVDEWGPAAGDGARSGTTTVSVAGVPIKLSGTLSLRPDGDGAVVRVEGDLKASVPLIGGRVEKAAEPAVLGAIRAEEKTAEKWFAGELT